MITGTTILAVASLVSQNEFCGLPKSRLELRTCEAPCVAEVVFANTLSNCPDYHGIILSLEGFEVLVEVETRDGEIPERLEITPPDGFMAVPPVSEIDDHAIGIIQIFRAELY